jgi:hypothetical protein
VVIVRLIGEYGVEGEFVKRGSIGEAFSKTRGKVVARVKCHAAASENECLQSEIVPADFTWRTDSCDISITVGQSQVGRAIGES